MRKQRIKTISFIIQGAYTLICFSEIVLCLIYKGAYDAAIGRISAEILLHLTFISFLLLLIMLPMSLVLNILAGPQNESRRG